jgi:hypothetical protein
VGHLDSSGKKAIEYAKKFKFQDVVDYLLSESKKAKELTRVTPMVAESEPNEAIKRKKREGAALNMNKNNYKLSVLRDTGEVHDLTEEEVQELFRTVPKLEGYLANPDSIPQ